MVRSKSLLKILATFIVIYIGLSTASVVINKLLGLIPHEGLNIGALVISILITAKMNHQPLKQNKNRLILAAFAGMGCAITLFLFSLVFENLYNVTKTEIAVTWLFNCLVAYTTLWLYNRYN